MTDAEINRRLAKALGWGINSYDPDYYNVDHRGTVISKRDFSPATDPNHLRAYVLPEVERRGLWTRFVLELISTIKPTSLPDAGYVDDFGCGLRCGITAEPRVLALAALRVMEETT